MPARPRNTHIFLYLTGTQSALSGLSVSPSSASSTGRGKCQQMVAIPVKRGTKSCTFTHYTTKYDSGYVQIWSDKVNCHYVHHEFQLYDGEQSNQHDKNVMQLGRRPCMGYLMLFLHPCSEPRSTHRSELLESPAQCCADCQQVTKDGHRLKYIFHCRFQTQTTSTYSVQILPQPLNTEATWSLASELSFLMCASPHVAAAAAAGPWRP